MALSIPKRIDLAFMGEGEDPNPWDGAYAKFKRHDMKDLEELDALPVTKKVKGKEVPLSAVDAVRQMANFLRPRFISGYWPDAEGKLIPIKKEELDETFPVEIYATALRELRVVLNPNA